jgi:diaminopimelate decarboxylase
VTAQADRPPYERPSLLRHRAGTLNKMGGLPALRPESHIDGVPVDELVAAYGSPVFVYSERTLVEKVHELGDALRSRWPRVELAWSYKTCYLDAVCRVFHREGAMAEAVSGMEVEKARRNGVESRRIVFNGPHKTRADLRDAFESGVRVNIDHYEELALAEAVAAELGLRPAVGLRLNTQVGSVPRWDRFGFNLEGGQAWDAVRRLVAGGRLRLTGLHCHLGTFILDTDAYRQAAARLAGFANRLRDDLDITIDTLDLGGGFASRARLKSQVLAAAQITPALGQYAEAITDGLAALTCAPADLPLLLLETGRALVDEAGTLVATVIANKRLADGRRAVVLDAGVNVLFTSFWYRHDVVPCAEVPGTPEPTVLFGPLCMNIDVVRDHIMMPPLRPGSRVLIRPVGAYNVTQSMQFIHLRPAVCMISRDGRHDVIRRKETLDDLVIGEAVPAWVEGG